MTKPIKKLSKTTTSEKLEASSMTAGKQGSGKVLYCWRCFTKGHGAADCNVTMYCPICNCTEHAKAHCPKWRGDKPTTVTCGYAVEGLVFFKLPIPPCSTIGMTHVQP
jgi:hypothetical protein